MAQYARVKARESPVSSSVSNKFLFLISEHAKNYYRNHHLNKSQLPRFDALLLFEVAKSYEHHFGFVSGLYFAPFNLVKLTKLREEGRESEFISFYHAHCVCANLYPQGWAWDSSQSLDTHRSPPAPRGVKMDSGFQVWLKSPCWVFAPSASTCVVTQLLVRPTPRVSP